MLLVALLACWFYARRRAGAFGVDLSHINLAVPLVFAVSLLGAEIITFISPRDAEIAGRIMHGPSRFRLFGLLLIGAPALFVYSRLAGLSFRRLADLFALPALLWLAVVRLGCFMAGCCWGDLVSEPDAFAGIADPGLARQVLTLPWLPIDGLPLAVSFPAESFAWQQHMALGLIHPGTSASLPVHPTQLYETVLLLLLIATLRGWESRRMPAGMTAIAALAGYCVLRFLIEFLRADNPLLAANLTLNQWICIALVMASMLATRFVKRMAPR
jgi:phosphatidylglycerol:prolipoprotein diacylglycerol transferase